MIEEGQVDDYFEQLGNFYSQAQGPVKVSVEPVTRSVSSIARSESASTTLFDSIHHIAKRRTSKSDVDTWGRKRGSSDPGSSPSTAFTLFPELPLSLLLPVKRRCPKDIYFNSFYSPWQQAVQRASTEENHVLLIEHGESGVTAVVSLLKHASLTSDGRRRHLGLRTTKESHHKLKIYTDFPSSDLGLVQAFVKTSTAAMVTQVPPELFADFANNFVKLEQEQPQSIKEMKIGVVYCKKGQPSATEWFKNSQASMEGKFWSLLKTLANEVVIDDAWTNYRGDLQPNRGSSLTAYYSTAWDNSVQIVYHVSCFLNEGEQRRWLGNDMAFLIYLEQDVQLSTEFVESLASLGQVPQLFCIVQPDHSLWQIHYCTRVTISGVDMSPPREAVDINTAKEFIISFLHNGLVQTKQCPPFNKFFSLPRQNALSEMCQPVLATAKPRKPQPSPKARKRSKSGGVVPGAKVSSRRSSFSESHHDSLDLHQLQAYLTEQLALLKAEQEKITRKKSGRGEGSGEEESPGNVDKYKPLIKSIIQSLDCIDNLQQQ